jgi:hypothetical protein
MQLLSAQVWGDFLELLPETEQAICRRLQQLIIECLPNCSEKLSYKVPFYKGRSNICYFWPSSVLWGNQRSYEGVRLGFVQGHLLYDDIQYLNAATRQYVRCRDFLTVVDIDADILRAYLYDAARVDEAIYRQKQAAKKKKR